MTNGGTAKIILSPLQAHCLCCLKADRDKNHFPTLGLFRPKTIRRLVIEPEDSPDLNQEQRERLGQFDMYRQPPAEELEKIPNKFTYDPLPVRVRTVDQQGAARRPRLSMRPSISIILSCVCRLVPNFSPMLLDCC